MTYEDLPDVIREKLFYGHQHDENGDIVYPEKVVLECIGILEQGWYFGEMIPKADPEFLRSESQVLKP